jgi:uncharacterized membrane protein YjgN (DUF898 family)
MNQDLPDLTPAANSAESLKFEFIQRPGLLKLTIVNFLFGLITLGLYRFWGKTNVRKHIWSSVHLNGEPLEYTGTGKELFKGFMMVLGVIFLPIAILTAGIIIVDGPDSFLLQLIQPALILFAYVFMGFALYKARKYQLSRTNWRGIRGTLVGSAMIYSLTYFGSLLAKAISLGWATPVMNTVLQEQIISDMRFGDAAFKFRGKAGKLYPTYALCWLLTAAAIVAAIIGAGYFISGSLTSFFDKLFDGTPPTQDESSTFGIFAVGLFAVFIIYMLIIPMLWAVYSAKQLRTFADYTRFDGSQFKLNVTAGSVIWLTFVNLLIIILTLGFGAPFVQRRLVRFIVDRLQVDGTVDIDRIRQSQVPLDSRGEGLADAFDVGGM